MSKGRMCGLDECGFWLLYTVFFFTPATEVHIFIEEMVRSNYAGLFVSGTIALGTLGVGIASYRYPHVWKRLASTFKPRARPRVVHAATKGEIRGSDLRRSWTFP